MEVKREFLNQYRLTWKEAGRKISELQDCIGVSAPDRTRIEVALFEAEMARLEYNAARDRLVAQMAGVHTSAIPAAQAVSQDGKVRAIARLLWEFTGEPDGTAVADWLQAERLVQSVSAAVVR